MRGDKHIAIGLRKRGKSYNEISQELAVPKSTLSNWLSGMVWSQNIKNELTKKANHIAKKRLRLLNKERRAKWERRREQLREEAKREFPKLHKNPLFVAGAMLYWAEGDSKIKNPFRLTNTDPRMMALYTKFLIGTLNISKDNLRIAIILYPDLSEKKCISFWSKILNIPKSQFYKTQFIKGRHPTKRLSKGICTIIIRNRQLKEKVSIWIDLLSQKLIK